MNLKWGGNMAYYPIKARVQKTVDSETVYYFRCNYDNLNSDRKQFIKNMFNMDVSTLIKLEDNIPVETGDLVTFDEGVTYNRVMKVDSKPKPTNRGSFNRKDLGIRTVYLS